MKILNSLWILALAPVIPWVAASFTGCGLSATGAELTGQVKKVVSKTPMICPDHTIADISLGVMRNGVGSMSSQDVEVVVSNPVLIATLRTAAEGGKLVKVVYNARRFRWCVPLDEVTDIVILNPDPIPAIKAEVSR